MEGATHPSSDRAHKPNPTREISHQLVTLLRRATGRGPTSARATIARDHVLVVLEETLTVEERTLVASGHSDKVIEARYLIQQAFKHEACAAVEAVVGRRVVAFMSSNHIDPDLATEVFILEPEVSRTRPERG